MNEITPNQKAMIEINIAHILNRIIKEKDNGNLFVVFGDGSFYFDPDCLSALYKPPIMIMEYGGSFETKDKEEIKKLQILSYIAISEIARLRMESSIELSYDSYTWIGPPTLIGEDDDISLMGALMQKYPKNYVWAGDFIRGFNRSGECLYEKILEFHSLEKGELEKNIKEELIKRLEPFEPTK